MKPPNLKYQDFDTRNRDLDKRFEPEKSCRNCKYSKIIKYDFSGNLLMGIFCKKYNYYCYKKGDSIIGNHKYPVCNDFFEG